MTLTEAKAALDAANAVYTPAAKALHSYRYNLSLSRAVNAKIKAELTIAEERAARLVRRAAHAHLAVLQEMGMR